MFPCALSWNVSDGMVRAFPRRRSCGGDFIPLLSELACRKGHAEAWRSSMEESGGEPPKKQGRQFGSSTTGHQLSEERRVSHKVKKVLRVFNEVCLGAAQAATGSVPAATTGPPPAADAGGAAADAEVAGCISTNL